MYMYTYMIIDNRKELSYLAIRNEHRKSVSTAIIQCSTNKTNACAAHKRKKPAKHNWLTMPTDIENMFT